MSSTSPLAWAVFLRMDGTGTAKWKKIADQEGVAIYQPDESVYAATLPQGLIIGSEGGVRAAVPVALKKAPAERYASVAAFAEDLRRYLDHRPVLARPDSLAYRARKYVRRHRAAIAIAASLAVLVVGAIISVIVNALRLRTLQLMPRIPSQAFIPAERAAAIALSSSDG